MTPQSAIEELESINSQFMHDPKPFDDIIAALKPLAIRICAHEGCVGVATVMGMDGNYCAGHFEKFGQSFPKG